MLKIQRGVPSAKASYKQKEGLCNFWVARKGRFCRLQIKETTQFCGEHMNTSKRIPCPFDIKQ